MSPLLRLAPLVSRLRSRLGGDSHYQSQATRSWVIHPEESDTLQAALFDPDDLQRITGVSEGDTFETEMERARGRPGRHTATVAYELRDVVLSGGQAFTWRAHHVVVGRRAPTFPAKAAREFDHAVLASTPYGIRYFGHWMADDLPLLMAAREIGEPVSVLTAPSPGQRGYMGLLGVGTEAVTDAYFKTLVVIDDVGQHSYKRARFERLRKLAAAHGSSPAPAGVMLLRGTSGRTRVLVNEAEVVAVARARGFAVLDPVETDAAEVLRACAGAKVVLGVEGSHLANGMLWMSDRGAMVVIQPPDRFNMILKNWTDCIGIRFAFVVGHAAEAGGFRADIGALNKMLDAVGA